MKKILTIPGVIIVLLSGVLLYFVFVSLKPKSKTVDLLPLVREERVEKPVAEESLYIEGAEISLVDQENRVLWRLVMKDMVNEGEDFLISEIEGEYFPPDGGTFQINAAKGRVAGDFSALSLFEEVVLSRDDLTLRVKELDWHSRNGSLLFGRKAVFEKSGMRVKAEYFKADSNLKRLNIEGESQWEFHQKDGE